MAKSTHAQEVATGTSASYTEDEMADPAAIMLQNRPTLGEVDRLSAVTDGGDSTQSSESVQTSSGNSNQSPPQPAPTTESHSSQPAQETDFAADSTDGNGQSNPTRQSARPRKATKAAAPRVRSTEDEDEFDEFA